MNDFTASNGVSIQEIGPVTDRGPWLTVDELRLSPNNATALREFFRAEEDARLGRWRWSTRDGGLAFVVTANVPPCSDWDLTVTCEQSGESMHYTRADDEGTYPGTNYFADAARAYFDAHPEPKPAWHDAKPGEVWLITSVGGSYVDEPAVFDGETFVFRSLFVGGGVDSATPDAVKDARRIYPEVAS